MEIRELIQNKRGQKFLELLFEQEVIDHALRQPITMDPQLNVITPGPGILPAHVHLFARGLAGLHRGRMILYFFFQTVVSQPAEGTGFPGFSLACNSKNEGEVDG
jgi:hypothetical protein